MKRLLQARLWNKKIHREDVYTVIDRIFFERLPSRKVYAFLLIAFLVSVFSIQAFSHLYTWDIDAPSFYTAAHGIKKGVDIYTRQEFQRLTASLFGPNVYVYPYLYWPVMAQVFIPFTLLSYPDYTQLLLLVNILMTLLSMALIILLLDLKESKSLPTVLFLSAALAVNRPLQTTLDHGQVNVLVFALVLFSLLLMKKSKMFLSSFFLCLAIYFKIYPLLFLGLYLVQKRYKYLLFTLLNGLWIFGLSLVVFSPELWKSFLRMGLHNFVYGQKTEFFFDYNAQWGNCSLNGLFSQLFIAHNIPRLFVLPALVLTAGVFLVLFKKRIFGIVRGRDLDLQASLVFLLSLVFSTITWKHHYVTMIFPLTCVFHHIMAEKRYATLLPFLALAIPILHHPLGGGFPFSQTILIAAVLFLGLMLHVCGRRETLPNIKSTDPCLMAG